MDVQCGVWSVECYLFVSQHPADHVDSRLVSPATTEEAHPASGVDHRVANTPTNTPTTQLLHLPGSLGLVESDGEREPRVTVNIHGLTLCHCHLAWTVQDVRLRP